jgi:hypothetical protein
LWRGHDDKVLFTLWPSPAEGGFGSALPGALDDAAISHCGPVLVSAIMPVALYHSADEDTLTVP